MKYCVKEVATTSRKYLGSTLDYPNNEWDIKTGHCVYRKYAATCPEESMTFTGSGDNNIVYQRQSYCCTSTLCNDGIKYDGIFCICTLFAI